MEERDKEKETISEVQSRHRKEKNDLRSVVTSKRKNATKKTRKAVNSECEELERELKERQAQEVALLEGRGAVSEAQDAAEDEEEKLDGLTEKLADAQIDVGVKKVHFLQNATMGQRAEEASRGSGDVGIGVKRNRQKERLARRQAEQLAAAEAAEKEASNMTDHRGNERKKMEPAFEANKLVEEEIRPDGHCLFSAVADQLQQLGRSLSAAAETSAPGYKLVRIAATDYMLAHPDDFAPFLLEEEEGLEGYVKKMRDTAEWGGQMELAALAAAYGVEIRVVQNGPTAVVKPPGEEKESPAIWLAYYRHGYGLGEHYNSLRKKAS